MVFPQLLHDLFVFEVDFFAIFEFAVHELEFLIELHLVLYQHPDAHQNVLYIVAKVDLFDLHTAEVLHLLALVRTTVYAGSQTVDIHFRREKQDHVRGKCKCFKDRLIQLGIEVLHFDIPVRIETDFCQIGLEDDNVNAAPLHLKELCLH